MKQPILKESFEWMGPEFETIDAGKETIRIRGVAMASDVVSKNNRKYVEEELRQAARTFVGKPITINHDPKRIVGTVTWMQFNPLNSKMEYLGDIKKQPYVDLLRSHSAEIKGVSIEADYLHMLCARCHKKFYSESEWHKHMHEEEFLKDIPQEPHGMLGKALSLVLSPEVPGYGDTSIELMESYQKPVFQLLETITQTRMEQENYMKKIEAATTPEQRIAATLPAYKTPEVVVLVDNSPTLKEGNDTKPIEAKEAPKKTEQPTLLVSPEISMPKLKESNPPALAEVKLPPKLATVKEKLTLGEPFAGYTDFADCVAKNRDKDNPEAYCGSIKHEVEGEMQFRKQTNEFLNGLVETFDYITKNQNAIFEYLKTQDAGMATYITDAMNVLRKDYLDEIAKIPPFKDDVSWKESLTSMDGKFKEYDSIKTAIATADQNIKANDARHTEEINKLKEENASLKQQIADSEAKKLKETADAKAIAQEAKTIAENVEDKMKGDFKAKAKPLTKETTGYTVDPAQVK